MATAATAVNRFLSPQELQFVMKWDLTSFIEGSFYELYPGRQFDLAPYIEVLATKLESVRRGDVRRLIINLPPRNLKSHCVSVAFIAWLIGHSPSTQALCVGHSQDLADNFGAACQRLMQSSFYRSLFGEVLLLPRQGFRDFETSCGGRRVAAAVGDFLTGQGADVIVIDDPHKGEDILCDASRRTTHAWFDQAIASRLNNTGQGSIVIVMQRLHPDDLVGHVLKSGAWDVLAMPAIAETDECYLIDSPLGRRLFRRSPGDVLNGARESGQSLARVRQSVSMLSFAAQYQQKPLSPEQGRAIEAERQRRFSEAFHSGDLLTLGRLFANETTGAPEHEIPDEQAMQFYEEWATIAEELEREF